MPRRRAQAAAFGDGDDVTKLVDLRPPLITECYRWDHSAIFSVFLTSANAQNNAEDSDQRQGGMAVKLLTFRRDGRQGLAASQGWQRHIMVASRAIRNYPGSLDHLIRQGGPALAKAAAALLSGDPVEASAVEVLQPLSLPGKIICVGLNYRDHAGESGMTVPEYPVLFARFASSLIAHGAPIVRPAESQSLDYEGELVAVIGKGGRRISKRRMRSSMSPATRSSTTPRSAIFSCAPRNGPWARISTPPARSAPCS